jgi:hypothetical protein
MINHDRDRQNKRSAILDELRMHFGEDRSGDLGDMDGLGLLSLFLRRLPGGSEGDGVSDEPVDDLSREDLRKLRHRRREKVADESTVEPEEAEVPGAAAREGQAAAAEAMTFGALIEEIPRMRENFAEWISAVDADYLPSSSTREELELLRIKAEYRLKVLKIVVSETERELDALSVAIRANEAKGAG